MKLMGRPRLIFIKTHKTKIKARILKAAREKKPYDGIIIMLSVDFSVENLQARRTANQEYFTHQSCPSEIKVESLEGVQTETKFANW